MWKLKLVPDVTRIRFIEKRFICLGLSVVVILASAALFFTKDLNYGIDFQGGILIEIGTEQPADIGSMRSALGGLGLGDVAIQEFGAENDVLIRVERQEGETEAQEAAISRVKETLNRIVPGEVEYRRVEQVGPKVSGELKTQGFLAVTLVVVATMIYIWFRFEWQFGVGAVVALIHDVATTIGFFAITGLEFNLSIIAAILTIVGYSLNDSVVVFDRIRENLRKYKKMELGELIDLSLNETLSRTLMTGMTTLLALVALFVFGGSVIQGFTAAMIWGVFVGTYSSIYIGAPILMWLKLRREEPEETAASAKKA